MSSPQPIDWKQTKDAIYDWFVDATGLQTYWADQSNPQKIYPYARLRIIAQPTREGQDEIRIVQNLGGAVGTEMKETIFGNRVITVSCQVFVDAKATINDHDEMAETYLAKAQSSLAFTSVWEALNEKGIGVVSEGSIVNVTSVIDSGFISQANMDVIFRVAHEAIPEDDAKSTTYIKTVEITSGTNSDPDVEIDHEIFGDI